MDTEALTLIRKYLRYRDRTAIAKELNLAFGTVCNVIAGRATSERVIKAALKRAVRNKKLREESLKYLRS